MASPGTQSSHSRPYPSCLTGVNLEDDDGETPIVALAPVPLAPHVVVLVVVAYTPQPGHGNAHDDDSLAPLQPFLGSFQPTSTQSKALVFECVWKDSFGRSTGMLRVFLPENHDWRALECTRFNELPEQVEPKRITPRSHEWRPWVNKLEPKMLLGDPRRRFDELGLEETREAASAANSIVHVFIEYTTYWFYGVRRSW